ncbi:hypothetical protein ACVW0Y_000423 [Pseudomonas sp. TE3786]
MHKRMALLFIALLSTSAAAEDEDCSPQEPSLASLRELLKSSPYELAHQEAKLEKPRFYGVLGYGRTVVNIDSELANCAARNGQVKDMPGTSDYLCTAEIDNLQPSALRFAEKYNLELAKLAHLDCN